MERDLWRSRAGAERCRGASLHLPVVMHAVYWSTEESGLPKSDVGWGWGSSGVSVVTITNVNSASARTEVLGSSGLGGWGGKLKICRYPVIGIGTQFWGTVPGGIDTIPISVLDLDIVRKGLYLFKAGLILGFSSLGIRLGNGECVIGGVNEGESWSVDRGIPLKGGELVCVIFTICIDKSEVVAFCCLNSNFVKFNFNFGLRQTKSG